MCSSDLNFNYEDDTTDSANIYGSVNAFIQVYNNTLSSGNKTDEWRERIELFWIWQGPCLMNTRYRISFGQRRLTPLATPSVDSRKHHMNSSPVKSQTFLILEVLGASALFLLKEVEIQILLLKQ